MAVSEQQRHQLYVVAESVFGAEGAAAMMELLPPVGWADVATKNDVDSLRGDLENLRAVTKSDLDRLEARLEVMFTAKIESTQRYLMVAILRVDELVAGYVPQVDILTSCDLYCRDGEIVGIIGPNGAGKSTLLKAMFGLVEVRSGTVTLRGENITDARADELVGQGVGYVPQTNNVFPSLTVEENLEMGMFQAPKEFAARLDVVASLFPALKDRRKQRAGSLSGGERQMVAMGRALMAGPSVILLDEPSAGLSPALQDEVFVRVREINRAGVSVVMVEQNARRCLQVCDRGYVLDQGRNAYTGPGNELIHDPKVVELYLGTLARVS